MRGAIRTLRAGQSERVDNPGLAAPWNLGRSNSILRRRMWRLRLACTKNRWASCIILNPQKRPVELAQLAGLSIFEIVGSSLRLFVFIIFEFNQHTCALKIFTCLSLLSTSLTYHTSKDAKIQNRLLIFIPFFDIPKKPCGFLFSRPLKSNFILDDAQNRCLMTGVKNLKARYEKSSLKHFL